VSAGTFFYVAEEALFRSRPRMALSDDSPGVREITFDYHRNKVVGEGTVECLADRWAAPPGSVVELEDQGPASKDGAIAAGANAKALSTYLGHSTVAFTLDRYGHLMPGNEAEAATLLDAYLGTSTG